MDMEGLERPSIVRKMKKMRILLQLSYKQRNTTAQRKPPESESEDLVPIYEPVRNLL